MLSEKTAADVTFYFHLMTQEGPFGWVHSPSEEAQPFYDIPLPDLTEEQAQILITDMKAQRARFFEQEAAAYNRS